ncbi:hypothetical protein C8J57DRAFT_1715081 [Mycena rebaudengoi]|nr:hypothetical protein C8J57DRAFT_1715081 [Mycena rebaudengoi]
MDAPADSESVPVQPDSIAALAEILEKQMKLQTEQIKLQTEQTKLLRQLDNCQASADGSQQPMPQVPASSSSAWNPLLCSALDTIEPTVERWRGGLDTLLIFVGLFSAIVTAFFVDSVNNLKPDETSRTNELLANLTDIIIALSKADPASLNLASPVVFEPESNDVRLNVYWSLSLVLSVSIAALAVSLRGFLARLTRSDQRHASKKLSEIYTRWEETNHLLGPTVEALPQLMVIPVALFLVGSLDNLFSSALNPSGPSVPVLVASTISSLFVAAVAMFLIYSLIDGLNRPNVSPFHSSLSRIILSVQILMDSGDNAPLHKDTSDQEPQQQTSASKANHAELTDLSGVVVTAMEHDIYHKVVQLTHNDDSLDYASTCLQEQLKEWTEKNARLELPTERVHTLLHFLSPEASLRCNLSAAAVLADSHRDWEISEFYVSPTDRELISRSLIHAAQRYASRFPSHGILWGSKFSEAVRGASLLGMPQMVINLPLSEWPEHVDDIPRMHGSTAYLLKVVEGRVMDIIRANGLDSNIEHRREDIPDSMIMDAIGQLDAGWIQEMSLVRKFMNSLFFGLDAPYGYNEGLNGDKDSCYFGAMCLLRWFEQKISGRVLEECSSFVHILEKKPKYLTTCVHTGNSRQHLDNNIRLFRLVYIHRAEMEISDNLKEWSWELQNLLDSIMRLVKQLSFDSPDIVNDLLSMISHRDEADWPEEFLTRLRSLRRDEDIQKNNDANVEQLARLDDYRHTNSSHLLPENIPLPASPVEGEHPQNLR